MIVWVSRLDVWNEMVILHFYSTQKEGIFIPRNFKYEYDRDESSFYILTATKK